MNKTQFSLVFLIAVTGSTAVLAETVGGSVSPSVGANQSISVGSNKSKAPASKGHTKAGGLKKSAEKVEHRSGGPKPGSSSTGEKFDRQKMKRAGNIGGHKHGSDQVSK